jgi:hypothetical protein
VHRSTTTTIKAKASTTHPGTTTTVHPIIPRGAPKTGLGDSSGAGPTPRAILGIVALILAALAATMSLRSRRRRSVLDQGVSRGRDGS